MAEISFEALLLALEATRNTPVTPPTHYLNLEGTIDPKKTRARKTMTDGTLAEIRRSTVVRKWSEWAAEGEVDVNTLPLFANMAIQGGVTSPTTPAGAVLSRLWSFLRAMTADNLKSATAYWGDPNIKMFQAAYAMLDEMTISADSTSEDAVALSLKGMAQYPTALGSVPTLPALAAGPILVPGALQLWIDTSSAFGTTAVTGRVLSTELTVPTGVSYKYLATGPGGSLGYSATGRAKIHPTCTIVVEFPDMVQYNQWDADATNLKVRVRLNGALIETVSAVNFYNYVQWDIYGPFDALDWGDLEGTNRTMELTIEGEYEPGLGSDLGFYVQSQRTSL